jgi:hypothetical protein
MTTAVTAKDPALSIGSLSLNDCRTVCRALKLRAAELKKASKKLKELDRPTEATSVASEADDIIARLGPKFDEGTFNFAAGPNTKPERNGKGKAKRGGKKPQDLAEYHRDRIKRGGK